MSFDRGTIVYADDPFRDDDSGRPWVIINTAEIPFHGDQYIALALTTKTWYDERLPIDEDDLIDGGLPKTGSILPWAVGALGPDEIDRELGTLADAVVDAAVTDLTSYFGVDYNES